MNTCQDDGFVIGSDPMLRFLHQSPGQNEKTTIPAGFVLCVDLASAGGSFASFFLRQAPFSLHRWDKDVLYDFLKRQDINWRGFSLYIALQLIRQHNLGSEPIRAAVVDDTIKHRRGKKVSAVSSHFDHMLGKQVIGQQMLEMGLATPKGYVPLDSRIYVSEKRIQDGKSQFRDKRSSVARDC
ncbi:MAG: transposase, partial [SAR324 cluster bacterium]|nr:transposase [SAR324 cluster bacterium]